MTTTPADWLAMYRERERRFGPISETAWRILLDLAVRGPSRVTAAIYGAEQPQSTGLRHVETLERRGLVRRAPDPADRRAHILELTQRAQALLEETGKAS